MTRAAPLDTSDELDEILDNAGCKEDYPDFKDPRRSHKPRTEAKAALHRWAAKETVRELEAIQMEVSKLSPKQIDKGNEAYNPNFKDFQHGFGLAIGFVTKFITNHRAARIEQFRAEGEAQG